MKTILRRATVISGLVAPCGFSASAQVVFAQGAPTPSNSAPAEPRIRDVLSSVTLSFDDAGRDRAILVQNEDGDADLYIYDLASDAKESGIVAKPLFVKKGVVFAGTMAGQEPSLAINGKGSLVITSTNFGSGRVRWTQTLTVGHRGGEFVITGITYSTFDDLAPNDRSSCDLNLLTGKGTRKGRPIAVKLSPIRLADWADEKLPSLCQD